MSCTHASLALHPRPGLLSLAVVAVLLSGSASAATDVQFNTRFLRGDNIATLQLDRVVRGELVAGVYKADIRVNETVVGRYSVELRADESGQVLPCFTPELVSLLGIDRARLPAVEGEQGTALQPLPESETFCAPLERYVPQASATFNANELILDVSVPQAYLDWTPSGSVNRALWDGGVNALRVNYSASHQRIDAAYGASQSTGVSLETELNLGHWRLHHDGYFAHGRGQSTGYRAGRSYARRSIPGWNAELTVGESSTRGDLFDAVSYRGATLATDARMLADSQSHYAPVVRGVAQTHARIVIRQLENVVYQTNVAPGPFELRDLTAASYGGDLQVEVTEADGRVQRFEVPFASVPQLLRVGQQRFSLTVGMLDDGSLADAPGFVEASLRRGLGNHFTGYTGFIASNGYASALLGGAWNTRFGAFSGDVTLSRAELRPTADADAKTVGGLSYRLAYNKNFVGSGTSIAMAAYRYSTDGYLNLADAARLRDPSGSAGFSASRQRSRMEVSVDQRLADRGGALFITGSSTDYWAQQQRRTSLSMGYANTWGKASYSISAQRAFEQAFNGSAAKQDSSLYFTLSMPLGTAARAPRVSAAVNTSSQGGSQYRAGISGSLDEAGRTTYSASAQAGSAQRASFDAGLARSTGVGNFNLGYSQSAGARGITLGASGGLLVHAGGVMASQRLGDAVGIVHVPGAAGAVVEGLSGVTTNAKGYAVMPSLSVYRRNTVSIDPSGLPLDVQLESASATAVPTAGAVVKFLVPTSVERSAVIEARLADGRPLPFGADVYDEAGEIVGVVGQASRLWVRGIKDSGRLSVLLDAVQSRCFIDYDTHAAAVDGMITAQCNR